MPSNFPVILTNIIKRGQVAVLNSLPAHIRGFTKGRVLLALFFNALVKCFFMNEHAIANPLIPADKSGKGLDLETSVTENSADEAITTFTRACKRLLNPPVWHDLSGSISASFKLTTPDSGEANRLAQVNDYLMIDIPGPGPVAGGGYDWVKVENIADNADPNADQSFAMTLSPSPNPDKPEQGIAHFFGEGATSTFIVKRKDNTVTCSYHGRNELPNTKKASFPDKIRNSLIAAGALAGISELQWKALIKGFLQKEIGG